MNKILTILFVVLAFSCQAQWFGLNRNYGSVDDIKFGYLYNGYVTDDARLLSSSDDWFIPSKIQYDDFILYVSDDANPIKKVGSEWWTEDRGQTNSTGFSAVGAGNRTSGSGNFQNILTNNGIWTDSIFPSNPAFAYQFDLDGNTDDLQTDLIGRENGFSIRLSKDATGISDGITTTYTGNDGTIYLAIAINEIFFTVGNLAETKYRNGDTIPTETDGVTWVGLTTGAKCAYGNDESNVFE